MAANDAGREAMREAFVVVGVAAAVIVGVAVVGTVAKVVDSVTVAIGSGDDGDDDNEFCSV